MHRSNIFESIPGQLDAEVFEDIVKSPRVRIERILSQGQRSPASGWYDQEEQEWVIMLRGQARILFEGGNEISLGGGDYVHIPAHTRHKVTWTTPDEVTVWLAVFYR